LHHKYGRPDEARDYYGRALAVDRKHVNTLCNLGDLHYEQERPDEARAYYKRLLAVDRKHENTLCNLGDLHNEHGRPDEARACYDRALAIDSKRVETLGQWLAEREEEESMVFSAAFSPGGLKVVSASWDNTLRVWSAATGECEQTLRGHTN
jgi:tetratricopeptide (TPR) repeat protein